METTDSTPMNPEPKEIVQEEIPAVEETTTDNLTVTSETGIEPDQTEEVPLPSDAQPEPEVTEPVAQPEMAEPEMVEPEMAEPENNVNAETFADAGVEEAPPDPTSEQAIEETITLEDLPEEHLEENLDEATEENVDHVIVESDINYDLHSREELVAMLEEAIGEPNFNAVKNKVALIKVAFLKKKKEAAFEKYEKEEPEGDIPEAAPMEVQDDLEIRFNELFTIYRANKARFAEEQEKIKQENLKKKFGILESLKTLINSEETLKKTYDEFKVLQDQWKEIGMVPRTEINNLWQNYHFLVEKFFEKVKLNKELKDLDLKKNLEAKILLCEKTEELLLETSIIKSFRKLQKYHEEWKEIGPVPLDKKDEIWERFKNATDKINERRREHYNQIEDEQNRNLETKVALCEQAEVVLELPNESIRMWQDNTNKINDLLKIWKNIGPVPKKENNEIWTRFKSALDAFYSNKKEYFDKLKEQQNHNYNLKVELCVQAEALNSSTDWKKTTNELIRLQNEWKKIGPVPRKHSDRLWKRFRAACDAFFNAKQAYFSNVQVNEAENLAKKNELLAQLKSHQFGDDKSQNLEMLKNFQRDWTEIGHVPMKEKDRLHQEFRALINEQMDKLKITDFDMNTANYQARLDHMKGDPNARRVIGKERETLATRIMRMKEEIILWENNIGFFARSKSADVVREEFENKINKAKSELKVLEAKMKLLRQQG